MRLSQVIFKKIPVVLTLNIRHLNFRQLGLPTDECGPKIEGLVNEGFFI